MELFDTYLKRYHEFPDEGQVIKSYASSVHLHFWMVINGCSAHIHSFNSCSKHTGAL